MMIDGGIVGILQPKLSLYVVYVHTSSMSIFIRIDLNRFGEVVISSVDIEDII